MTALPLTVVAIPPLFVISTREDNAADIQLCSSWTLTVEVFGSDDNFPGVKVGRNAKGLQKSTRFRADSLKQDRVKHSGVVFKVPCRSKCDSSQNTIRAMGMFCGCSPQ